MRAIIAKHKELLLYGIVGCASTGFNIFLYFLFEDVLRMPYLAANGLAWLIGVGAVFLANKYIVFGSRERERLLFEAATFFLSRVISGAFDMAFMFVFVGVFGMNGMLAKVIDNVLVIIFNYAASKLVIFKKGKEQKWKRTQKSTSRDTRA
jgi:putative flippase GtrA